MKQTPFAILALFFALVSGHALALGSNSHQMVAAIADVNLKGSNAEKHVREILGQANGRPLTLEQVAVWPDCVRGIHPEQNFAYDPRDAKPGCSIFEDAAGIQAMVDYVKRNNSNCEFRGKASECHRAFHTTRVAIEHRDYHEGYAGTSDHDVVHAIEASIAVLQGKPAPAPFNIKDKKEALMMLTHFIGELHQPLHVGTVYLDPQGNVVDPERAYDPETDTRGGTRLVSPEGTLHRLWDDTDYNLSPAAPGCAAANTQAEYRYTLKCMAAKARNIPETQGPMETWPAVWASETVLAARQAFKGLTFSPQQADNKWPVKFDDKKAYLAMKNNLQYRQVIKAGARLTQVLKAIWPD